MASIDQSELTDVSQTDQSINITKYSNSIEENFPGVYQYKAEVSLLPLGFYLNGDEATEKLSSDNSDTNNSTTTQEDMKTPITAGRFIP